MPRRASMCAERCQVLSCRAQQRCHALQLPTVCHLPDQVRWNKRSYERPAMRWVGPAAQYVAAQCPARLRPMPGERRR